MFNLIKNIFSNIKEKDDDIKGGRKKTGGNIISLNHLLKSKRQKIYTIETPDKLLEQINKTLPFTKKAKDERGEVFTPMTLVNEMLDTLNELPEKVWKNPNLKWLDPAAGMGNFPVAVYMRLMEGLKDVIIVEEKRRKHILENMLYMVELDKTNVFMMKKIFCDKKYELNIFEGSFIDGKYEKKIDIFSINDNEKIKIQKNIDFVNKIKKFNNNFDIIMGNPPYNRGGISSKKKNIELEQDKKTIWPDFIEKSFTILKTSGYLLFVNPLSWVKNTHKLHKVIFEKYIIYLELWDDSNGKKLINGELPISIFLLKNIENTNNNKTIIKIKNDRYNYYDDFKEYLDKDLSLPLGYIDKLLKLRRFVIKNNCSLEYKTTKSNDTILIKNQKKELNELKYMSIDDIKKIKETNKYCIDTYELKDKQYQLNITKSYHPDYSKRKLILSHKSELEGIFIDSGKLGICGTHNYYILGNNLTLIKKILSFDIIKKAGIFTKYGQNFLDTDFFTYVPDLRKLGYTNITEDEFNKLIGISFIKKSKSGNKSISLPKKHKSKKSHKRNKSI
jgi:16S rRNA G966 N2-methylase RsmD